MVLEVELMKFLVFLLDLCSVFVLDMSGKAYRIQLYTTRVLTSKVFIDSRYNVQAHPINCERIVTMTDKGSIDV